MKPSSSQLYIYIIFHYLKGQDYWVINRLMNIYIISTCNFYFVYIPEYNEKLYIVYRENTNIFCVIFSNHYN